METSACEPDDDTKNDWSADNEIISLTTPCNLSESLVTKTEISFFSVTTASEKLFSPEYAKTLEPRKKINKKSFVPEKNLSINLFDNEYFFIQMAYGYKYV